MTYRVFRIFTSLLLVAAFSLAGVSPALAAPPTNDNFGSATVIGAVPFSDALDTSEATAAPDDPTTCTNNGSVWYVFTPGSDMIIEADTFGSDYDTVLSVYTGTQGALTQVPDGCNDDFLNLQSKVHFNATGGTTYYFLIGTCCGLGGTGGGSLVFSVHEVVPPSNDNFANSKTIESIPFSATADTRYATTESGEPLYWCYTIERTVWYSFTPSETMAVRLSNQGSSVASSINIYRSSGDGFAGLNFISCTGSFDGSYDFLAEGGQTYYFQASLFPGRIGTLQLDLEQLPPPANDNFLNAEIIPLPLPFDSTVNILAATTETNEPVSSCGPQINTVWYAFTPTTSSLVSATTYSNFGSMLAAYTGNSLDGLTEIGCHPYYYYGPLTFQAETGTTYYFQVGSVSGTAGSTGFHLEVTPPPTAYFYFYPFNPSIFDNVQFCDQSYDPGGIGFQSLDWDFGDGKTASGYCQTHRYAADGDYTLQHSVMTTDGRTGSISQLIQVRTHDVSITKVAAPKSASVGQTKAITVSVRNTRYADTTRIDLYRSVPGGNFEWVATLTKLVPVRSNNRTTQFSFNYTFTAQDAQIGKVTFKAVVTPNDARDAFPADNEAISVPPTVVKGGISYP